MREVAFGLQEGTACLKVDFRPIQKGFLGASGASMRDTAPAGAREL